MSLLSRRRLLAVATIMDIAMHARPAPVAAKALAERLDLPPRHLESLLQALVHARILKGVRGPKGGYELARERRRISVADIVRAIGEETDSPAPALVENLIRPAMEAFEQDFITRLDGLTIADLCQQATPAQPLAPRAANSDFTI